MKKNHNQKKYEDWENSVEGIHYDFAGCHGLSSLGESFFFIALSKLPKKVINFAKNNIFFEDLDPECLGTCHNFKTGDISKKYRSLIIFSSSLWGKTEKEIEDTVAHEIAHAYLKHDILWNHSLENELAADKQAGEWLKREVTNYKIYDLSTDN